MKIKSAVDAERNRKQRGQLKKSDEIGFSKQLLVFVKLLIAFMKRIDLHLPCVHRFIVVFYQMQFR